MENYWQRTIRVQKKKSSFLLCFLSISLLSLINTYNVRIELFLFMTIDIPLLNKMLDKFNELKSLIRFNINDEIYIFFHMSTNVTNSTHTVNYTPLCSGNLIFKFGYLSGKIGFFDVPKIADHSLKAAAR